MGIYRAKKIGVSGKPRTSSTNKRGLPPGKLKQTYPDNWDQIRIEIFTRDNWTCRRCNASLRGKASKHVHHIMPLSKGGSNRPFNLISLCGLCHDRQHLHMSH